MWDRVTTSEADRRIIFYNNMKKKWCVGRGSSDERKKFVSSMGSANLYDESSELMCSAGLTADSHSNDWYHTNWNTEENVSKDPIRCNCIAYNGYKANCGQDYKNYTTKVFTPWCYISPNCNHLEP
jgi:hypothetical protein